MLSVYKEPNIIEGFLTPDLCDLIIKSATNLTPSTVNFKSITDLNYRKSFDSFIEDKTLLDIIFKKCAKVLRCHTFDIELPAIVYYDVGGFYTNHYDSSDHHKRDFTFICALNDEYEGGETYFPKLNSLFKLKKGDALFFHNYNTDGSFTELSLHGGKPVKSGEKWICNLWVRKSPY